MRLRSLSRFLLLSLALTGLLVQCIQLCQEYFAYATVSRVEFDARSLLLPYNLTVCAPFAELMPQEEDKRPTFADIFSKTPGGDSVISSCRERDGLARVRSYTRRGCASIFSVSKSVVQDKICYQFIQRGKRDNVSVAFVNRLPSRPHEIASLVLSPSFANASRLHVILYEGEYPNMSRDYVRELQLPPRTAGVGIRISISIAMIFVDNLPPPYQNGCQGWLPGENPFRCLFSCMIERLSKIAVYPVNQIILPRYLDSFNHRPLLQRDLLNDSVAASVARVHEDCIEGRTEHRCPRAYVVCHFTTSHATVRLTQTRKDSDVRITAETPASVEMTVTYVPSMTLVSFLSLLCTCVGIWTGVSLLSLASLDPLV